MKTLSPSSSTVADAWPQPLIDVLERQQSLVEQLTALAGTQAALIAERRTDRLLDLLSRRQSIIDEFTVCQAQMAALSHDLDRRISLAAPAQRERIRGLIASISEALRGVMDRDQQDEAALDSGRSAVLAEMSGLDSGRVARAAYGPPAPAVNRFADRHG